MTRIVTAACLAACIGMAPPAFAETFSFVAIGDMPYGKKADVYPKYESLIAEINKREPAFTIHIGDTKSGSGECSDQWLTEQLGFFNSFGSALIYTPGDNEWTDCYRKAAGSMDPLERLAFVRQTYFADPSTSLGAKPIEVESQAVVMADRYSGYPENARFDMKGVMIMTTHVVGSNNNFEIRDPAAVNEFFGRNEANIAWLEDSFDKAVATNARAVVLAMQADMFEFDFNEFGKEGFLRHSGFKDFGEKLAKRAAAFGKPVLLVYGDSHIYRIGRPFKNTAPNLIGLEVFGESDMHGVQIDVDTDSPEVFGFRPIMNPALVK